MNNLEDLLARIGNAGFFQVVMVFFIKMPAAPFAWTLIEMSFVKAEPEWCCAPRYVSQTPESYCKSGDGSFGNECSGNSTNCSTRVFEDDMDTMVNEWDLVCDDKWKANLSISIQMAGDMLGALITGMLADFIGRKKTFYISVVCLTVFSLIAGFSTSWEMFTILRFLLGMCCGIYFVVSIPYMMEFLSPSKREVPAILPVYPLGGLLMALTAWQLHDWRWVHWICAAMMCPFLLSWFFVPESLRWLTIKGKLDEAEKVVKYIARLNGKDVPKDSRKVLESVYQQEKQVKDAGKTSYNYLDIYRGRNLLKLSVILQIVWFSFSFCGFGIVFGASTLGLNLYLNLSILATVGIPVLLVLYVAMLRFGRKSITVVLMSMSAVCGFASLIVHLKVSDEDDSSLITNILCLAADGFLGGAWTAMVVLNNESYPTVLRSLGYAAANIASKIGAILAPFAFDFDTMTGLAYGLIGGLMGLCALLTLLLKETHGHALPDTMQEAQATKDTSVKNRAIEEESQLLLGQTETHRQQKYGDVHSKVPQDARDAAFEIEAHNSGDPYDEKHL